MSIMADTKAMAGHSDILAGHVASRNPALIEPVKNWRRLAGALVSPFDAYLLHRGLETLELRVGRANSNALAIATALSGDPRTTYAARPRARAAARPTGKTTITATFTASASSKNVPKG